MRFSVVGVKDGPWLVVDRSQSRKAVASCAEARAAETFAALMNGDLQAALASRDAALVAFGQGPASEAA